MARMIPPIISDEVKSTGEKQIFELLKNAPGTNDWIILHSLGLSKHVKRLYGEIDFVVLAPKLGIFCLEIKSGNIKRSEGVWHYTNRFGESTKTSRGPFQQAQEGMFSLIEAIKRNFGNHSRFVKLLFGYGVVFPHVLFDVNGTDIEPWQIYDRDSRRYPISNYIKQLSTNFKQKVSKTRWFSETDSIPTIEDINKIVNFLRGDFERLITPKQLISDVENQLNAFTAEQYKCLDELRDNTRCLFQGPAGTGKTIIAIESVKRNLFKNKRVLFLCFNVLLGKWLASQFDDKKNLVVGSLHQIFSHIVQSPFDIEQEVDDKEEYFKHELPLLTLEAIDSGKMNPFDLIVIDEGQDIICPDNMDVLDALLKGGITGGEWQIYCDFERQAIFTEFTAQEMMHILDERSSYTKFHLTVNCRNTKPIGEEIELISGFSVSDYLPGKIDGIPVEYYFYKDTEDKTKILGNVLNKLRGMKIPSKDITILSPFQLKKSCTWNINKSEFQIEETKTLDSFTSRNKMTYSTIHGFKGLENSYVVLTDISRLNDDEFKSLLYIGMSRAKVGLIVLIDDKARKAYNDLLKKKYH